MASRVTADRRISDAERVLLKSIQRYDIRNLLATASYHDVISDEERREIIKHAQGDQRKMQDYFIDLIVDNDRFKPLASFVLHYNNPVQNAALEVINPRPRSFKQRIKTPPTNRRTLECMNGSDSPESSSSSRSSTPPSPMDVDTKESLPSQAGEMPTQQPSDVGYFSISDSSKEISQDQSRYYGHSRSSHQFQPTRQEKEIPVRKSCRKHKRKAKRQPTESDSHDLLEQQSTRQFTNTTLSGESVEKDSCRKARISHDERGTSSWPPAHSDLIIKNLNMDTLLPHLITNSLLTRTEFEHIHCDREKPSQQNCYFVYNVLPRKGESGHKVFLECLKATKKEHLGHEDIINLFIPSK